MPAVVTRRPYHCLYPLPPHTLYPSTHSLQAKTPVVVARRLILCICSSTPLTVSAHRPICCPQKCQRKLPVDQSFSLPLIPSSLCPSTNPLPIDPPLCPSAHSLPTKMLTEIDHQSFRCLFPSSPHSLCSFTHSARQNARYSCPSTHSLTLPVYVLTVSAR